MLDLATLTPEQFDPLVGTRFAVNDIADVLELVNVARLNSPSPRPQPFSLTFASRTHKLTQDTFRLGHVDLGTLDVFLVPLQPDARGGLYEAVFN